MKEVNQDTEFLKESLKQRPLNRRKLLRRLLVTVLLAVVFGTVASTTFLLLEPLISEYLYPEEEIAPELIFFPEDITVIEEEILPENMIADEREMLEIQHALEVENNPPEETAGPDEDTIRQIASELIAGNSAGIEDFVSVNNALLETAREAQKALVTVTGLTSDTSWINTVYESRDQASGVIVGETSREILVLANISSIRNADNIVLTFADGRQYPTEIKMYDSSTGLAVLSLRRTRMDERTIEAIKVIELGNSSAFVVTGAPIIAIGRVLANTDSTVYGYVTSASSPLFLVDASYKLLTSDIYGNTNASGVLLNVRGQVIGIIDNSYNTYEARNIVSAIGISELKKLIETLCNGIGKPYVGIIGMDVTVAAQENLGVPRGVYVTSVLMDTPAMDAGLQSGDVIIKVNETETTSYYNFVYALYQYRPEQTVTLTVMRQGAEGYVEFETEVTTR
jgi:serine protease Do